MFIIGELFISISIREHKGKAGGNSGKLPGDWGQTANCRPGRSW
jgi:hypothetical protein